MTLTLDQALEILAAARGEAAVQAARPLAYAVVDAGGRLLAQQRDERAAHLHAEIALNKAWSCIALGLSSGRLARGRDEAAGAWLTAAPGRLVAAPGGVFIRSPEGVILGALGISGEAPAVDEAIAVEAIEALGLEADTEGD